jgi:EAL domain-containing protein (putative c-di-GMP-specific phosphodiesterase class I)
MTLYRRFESKNKMIEDLKNAIIRDEFILMYQPQLDIRTSKIIGAEALIRWNHPKLGMIFPDDFIPLAEETGLIIPIGEWVIRTACRQNKMWMERLDLKMIISVNLSAVQFNDVHLVSCIKNILNESGLSPQYLELEITESMTMHIENTIHILKQLKELGVHISMDDFGKGYSSLYYLKRFPLDTLKIDRSFINECITDHDDAMIVKTVISMAHNLKLNVVAEGVETSEQLIFLQQNRCDSVQGYLFSKPVSPKELEDNILNIQNKVISNGISPEISEELITKGLVAKESDELIEIYRRQQGMIFKYKKENNRLIHTFADGELLYRWNMVPEQISGKELFEFCPKEFSVQASLYLERAWMGEENIFFMINIGDKFYFVTLLPIYHADKVFEVVGNVTDVTEFKKMESELRTVKNHLRYYIEKTGNEKTRKSKAR